MGKKIHGKDNIVVMPKTGGSRFGLFLAGIFIVYITVALYNYFTSKHIAGYEVKEGSLAVNNTYRGVCLRDETVYNTNDSGYLNYYAREGERVPYGAMVYTVDESGKLNELLKSSYEREDSLTNEDMDELRTQIINYRSAYTDYNFDSVYDFKFSVDGTVMKLANQNVLTSMSEIKDQNILSLVQFGYAQASGIVVYSTDGMEQLSAADITPDIFDEENHQKTQLRSGELVSPGDPAYKLINQENWSIVIPVTQERMDELAEHSYIEVKFIKTGDRSWGKVNCFNDAEGNCYCKLDFTNSMITFATDRYLDIELLLAAQKGLKIPNSAIVNKEFYMVPESFYFESDSPESCGFLREIYLEDGSVDTEFVKAQIYKRTDEEVFVDTSAFRLGDYLVSRDSLDKFAIGKKSTLMGVYNINKGYADFTQITVLYQNREYSIVRSNTDYGLAVYDHIVLDGKAVDDDEFIFE